MTWSLLAFAIVLYTVVLIWIRSRGWLLRGFVWGAVGHAYLVLQFGLLINLAERLASLEALHIQTITNWFSYQVRVFESTTLLVPDSAGWVSMTIGLESSTLIEMSICSGLILHYPGFSRKRRFISTIIGIVGTYVLNIVRLLVIVLILFAFGREAFTFAHSFFGRIIFFIGVVALYWYLLTRPTITLVQQAVEEREQ